MTRNPTYFLVGPRTGRFCRNLYVWQSTGLGQTSIKERRHDTLDRLSQQFPNDQPFWQLRPIHLQPFLLRTWAGSVSVRTNKTNNVWYCGSMREVGDDVFSFLKSSESLVKKVPSRLLASHFSMLTLLPGFFPETWVLPGRIFLIRPDPCKYPRSSIPIGKDT